MKLIKSIHNYRFVGRFKNFLFTIAVNTCNDYHRKPKYIYEDIRKLEKGDKKPKPIEIIIKDEISKDIKEEIDALPDIQKDAIILYYYHDIKVRDIAKITGVGLSIVKSRLRQGREKLKRLLDKEDYFEK